MSWFSPRACARTRCPARRPAILGLGILEDRSLLSSGIGVFTPATNTWALRYADSAGPADLTFQFGGATTATRSNAVLIPVVGDWNGDGRDDIATFNPASATWALRYELAAESADGGTFQFGTRNSIPVVGDWNGDRRDDIGTFNPENATWTLRYGASPGLANAGVFQFGSRGSIPVAGDWNGDGKDGIGVFQPSSTT